MSDALIRHFRKYVPLNEEAAGEISGFFQPVHLKKKENILSEGQICSSLYFVDQGCLRMFFINEKGIEQTTQFAIESWWLSSLPDFEKQQASQFYIQAVEATDVLALTLPAQERLLQQIPALERYFRMIYQKAYGAMQLRIKYLYGFSREEAYDHFHKNFPEFVQRVPQYLLASYLDFTPEYLSEIRRKKLS